MQQYMPNAINPLKGLGAKILCGLDLLEEAVGVKLNTKTVVSGNFNALVTAQNEAQTAKAERKSATARLTKTNANVAIFIMLARDVVKPKLGSRYSVAWNELGFLNNSLGVPRTMNARLGHLKVLSLYFSHHPEMEVPGSVTAAKAAELYETYLTDITASAVAWTTMRQNTRVRDAAAAKLRRRIRCLFQELRQLMPRDDARWLEFGFNIPAAVSVPAAPEGLVVKAGLPGKLSASWEKPSTTERFRVFCKILGHDTEFVAMITTTETSAVLNDLPSGARVQIYVTAANSAGESQPGEIEEVGVP